MAQGSSVSKLGIIVVAVLVLGLVGFVFLRPETDERGTLERAREAGLVRVGIANEAPYGYLDTDTGEVTGEAPEVARAVLAELGVEELEVVNTDFGSLIPGLKARRFDLIAAGMYITPERCLEIDFSDPTYRIGEAFLVRAGNPLDLHSYTDVAESSEARLGVVAGTVEVGYAEKIGVPKSRLVIFSDNVSALEGVRTGQVDAFAGTALTVQDLLAKADTDELERAQPFEQPVIDGEEVWGYGAFGFRPDDDGFREAFDAVLDDYLGTDEHLDLVRPFGFTEQELPGNVSAAELCRSGD